MALMKLEATDALVDLKKAEVIERDMDVKAVLGVAIKILNSRD